MYNRDGFLSGNPQIKGSKEKKVKLKSSFAFFHETLEKILIC